MNHIKQSLDGFTDPKQPPVESEADLEDVLSQAAEDERKRGTFYYDEAGNAVPVDVINDARRVYQIE